MPWSSGQYHDAETGLHYNFFRYYDPETASYLTPDPLGLDPAPNHHTYVPNPATWSDPLGLEKCPDGDYVNFYGGEEGGVMANVKDGVLSLAIEKGPTTPRGAKMFDDAINHFGPHKLSAVEGRWAPAIRGDSAWYRDV